MPPRPCERACMRAHAYTHTHINTRSHAPTLANTPVGVHGELCRRLRTRPCAAVKQRWGAHLHTPHACTYTHADRGRHLKEPQRIARAFGWGDLPSAQIARLPQCQACAPAPLLRHVGGGRGSTGGRRRGRMHACMHDSPRCLSQHTTAGAPARCPATGRRCGASAPRPRRAHSGPPPVVRGVCADARRGWEGEGEGRRHWWTSPGPRRRAGRGFCERDVQAGRRMLHCRAGAHSPHAVCGHPCCGYCAADLTAHKPPPPRSLGGGRRRVECMPVNTHAGDCNGMTCVPPSVAAQGMDEALSFDMLQYSIRHTG